MERGKYYEELKRIGLQRLQDSMSRTLGLAALVTYPDGRPLTKTSNLCSFCALLDANPEGSMKCTASRVVSARAAVDAGRAVLDTCHAGLVHLAVPFRVAGETIAVLVSGSVALRPLREEAVAGLAGEAGIDRQELLAAARTVPIWPEERLWMAAEMMQQVTETVGQLLYTRQELQRKVGELSLLFEFSERISGSLQMGAIARQGLQTVLDLTGSTSGSVIILGEAELGARGAEVAATLEPCSELRIIPPEEIIAAVGRQGIAAHFESRLASEKKRPAIAIPLKVGGKVTGVLTLAGKPGGQRFTEEEAVFLTPLGTILGLALENARLCSPLREYYLSTVHALAAALEVKDVYTRGHSIRVAKWARSCARMLGLGAEEEEEVYLAGLLHDVGKIGIRENILLKPTPLTPEDRKEIQSHPEIGARILEPARFPAAVIAAVRHHHEDYGGGGYPAGLQGEEIPLLARIIRVADAYDAMTSARPYRKALTPQEAREELKRCIGRQFDRRVVEAFLRIPEQEMQEALPPPRGGGIP
ncbi:MAG: hypothetical protein PWP58_1220 [Bacillota bacterium]|nr:hypothetical protein [Bacillota bacterium]